MFVQGITKPLPVATIQEAQLFLLNYKRMGL
jgi:hypothetical protein